MAITQVRLQGTLNNPGYPSSSPGLLGCNGTIYFRLDGTMRDTVTGITVSPGVVASCAVIAGAYDITVYATDAAGVAYAPATVLYEVWLELTDGSTPVLVLWGKVSVPAALSGGGFGLDDLVPIIPTADDLSAHISNTAIHSGGRELAHVEQTLDNALAASTTGVDIPSMAVSAPTSGKAVGIWFGGHCYDSALNVTDSMLLLEDGVQVDAAIVTLGAIASIGNLQGYCPRTPSPGSHIYKLQMSSLSTGHTVHAYGGANAPLYLSIRENP